MAPSINFAKFILDAHICGEKISLHSFFQQIWHIQKQKDQQN